MSEKRFNSNLLNKRILRGLLEDWINEGDYDKTLDISSLNLIKFPNLKEIYPELENVKRLVCKHNLISEIDSKDLPSKLEYFDCSYNQLTYIPELPITLFTLICNNNKINGLPDLSDYINTLVCSYNQLKELEGVSGKRIPATLEYLDCSYNHIEKIYELPASIHTLILKGNPLKENINFYEGFDSLELYVSSNSESEDYDSQSCELDSQRELEETIELASEWNNILLDDGKNIMLSDRNYILENSILENNKYKIDGLKLSKEKYDEIILNDSGYFLI